LPFCFSFYSGINIIPTKYSRYCIKPAFKKIQVPVIKNGDFFCDGNSSTRLAHYLAFILKIHVATTRKTTTTKTNNKKKEDPCWKGYEQVGD
jgi:hypothetical protein